MPRNEASVAPYLPPVAPRLLWQVEEDDWLFLGFEHVAGRHADLSPGSVDLPLITYAVTEINAALTPCPAVAVRTLAEQWQRLQPWQQLRHEPPDALNPWTRANLDRFTDIGAWATELVAGDSLIHTDLHGQNILISDDRAHVIDWAWARQGAPWVDAAFMVIRLIAVGSTPENAEQWASSIPAWRPVSDAVRFAFAVGVLGMWEWLEHTDPLPHRTLLTDAVRTWAQHRNVLG
jgi:Ser/Thr protein kinase RdoA (MazF antagonist)